MATGGGPPPEELTPAEILALGINKGPKLVGIEGGSSSNPVAPEIRAPYVEVKGDQIILLDPPQQGVGHDGQGRYASVWVNGLVLSWKTLGAGGERTGRCTLHAPGKLYVPRAFRWFQLSGYQLGKVFPQVVPGSR
ncbi:hypothetical protein JOB18_005433 [Solea senegalensis]|uniref:Uncharacterized protein n=1 Tax=Solea senegalensis TaxID=28829 RepID=A0AAV6SYL0_SOLSE|nr:hypothetical protein JOB18_005433 [Solea senegalensis]